MNKYSMLRTAVAILIALALSALLICISSDVPLEALYYFLFGPVIRLKYFSNVLELTVPLIFTGLALSIIYQSRNFNLIVEACFFIGAIIASWFAIKIGHFVGITPIVAMIFAGLVGGVIGTLPGIIKLKWKANELVTSLMFNYIFYFFGLYIINHYLRDPEAGIFASFKFSEQFYLPVILPGTRLHLGFIVAIALVFLVYIYIYKTKQGYEIRLIGSNPEFAKYSGVNIAKVLIMSQFIAGAIAGIGGAVEMAGMYRRFLWESTPTYAWDGVIVAVLARNNPKFVPVAAFFLGYLRIGADLMARRTDVDNNIVSIIQGIMLLLIAAERFMQYFKEQQENKAAKEKYLQNKLGVQ